MYPRRLIDFMLEKMREDAPLTGPAFRTPTAIRYETPDLTKATAIIMEGGRAFRITVTREEIDPNSVQFESYS